MLIDSHAHLDMPEFGGDRNEVIQRARAAGIGYILTVGIDLESCRRAIQLSEKYDSVYAIVGIHPHNARIIDNTTYDTLKVLAQHDKVCALGEIGLDFYRNLSPRDVQKVCFREMIRLARGLNLPVVVHNRNAHQETIAILMEEGMSEGGGVIHCFSGDFRMAQTCIDMGLYISIPGTVTFHNAFALQEVVKRIPLDRILVETDCPFLAPVPFRGKRNEPSYVSYVAAKIAELKKVDIQEVAHITTCNARRVFHLGQQVFS